MHGLLPGAMTLQRRTMVFVLALGMVGCIPQYQPPTLNEPHAVVKVRLAYHGWPGPQVDQVTLVDGHAIQDLPSPPQGGEGVITRAVRVRPGATDWSIKTAFFHTNMVTRTESYTTTQSYPCGRSMCSRSTPHTRTVTQTVRVNDAVCETGMRQSTSVGATYILQYDFFAHERCQLHCFEQVPQADGSLGNLPCREAPAPAPR
jgi:hypothetical protein